jgi:hypothetical protein
MWVLVAKQGRALEEKDGVGRPEFNCTRSAQSDYILIWGLFDFQK